MNKEETKKLIKIMQAYVDGKEIQFIEYKGEWADTNDPVWMFNTYSYRIKPEPKYRPFTAEEAISYVGNDIYNKSHGIFKIHSVDCDGVYIFPECKIKNLTYRAFIVLADEFTFKDGTPCGVLVEE